ncbi:hypothetical protein E1287_34710 [Actinomadura sp. KC06]|uniref:hypothetical protein n=1 Tax=Actinomadura sp. KC06 TaxID=2530369 RepID=UPI001050305D|nr:hypothetical protein [Actinomadura sp. KC06]TDD27370.1 hypothetical protein E1287_34710 [Actinomadura sp. KC06]
MTPPEPAKSLAELLEDFPDFACRYDPCLRAPWEATRKEFGGPAGGGYIVMRAETAPGLRDLIDGALQMEAQRAAEGAARAVGTGTSGRCVR